MKRKPLEGIESLTLAIGAGLGYFLAIQGYTWWIVLLVVVVASLVFERLVKFLKAKNDLK